MNGKLDISEFSSLKTPRKSEKSGSNSSMKLVHLLSANHINYNPSASNTPGSKSTSATGTPVTPASLGGYAASVQYTPFMQHFRQSFNNGDLFQLKLSLLPRKARSVITTHSLTHSLAYSPTHSLAYSLTHLLTHSLTHSLAYSLTGLLTHSPHEYQIRPSLPRVPSLGRSKKSLILAKRK